MAIVHETEENFLKSAVVLLNKANLLGLSDAAVAAISPTTVAGLITKVSALSVHETFQNYIRQIVNAIRQMAVMTDAAGAAVITNAEVATAVGTGTFAALKSEFTEHSNYSSTISSLDFGEQAVCVGS